MVNMAICQCNPIHCGSWTYRRRLLILISNRATVIRAAAGTLALLIVVGCWHFGFVPSFLEACLFAANGLAVFLYGLDKLASKIGTRRAPEASLVALGCLGGWPAAYIAQFIFRHKTQKLNFQIACLASVILNSILLGFCLSVEI